MFESLNYIPGFTDRYESELSSIEAAAEREAARVEAERAKLVRRDGSAVYMPQEQQEREAAILEAAGVAYDQATSRYVAQAEREIADLERKLILLDGADPLSGLTEAEQQRAVLRREFAREDMGLPSDELSRRVRAVVAAGDKATAVLYARYLPGRDGPVSPRLREAINELEAFLGITERVVQRRDLEARLRAAQMLPVAVGSARRTVDGANERMLAEMRQRVGSL